MMTSCAKTGATFLVLYAMMGWAGVLHAQAWVHETNVFGPNSVSTAGGITYAEYDWVIGGCGAMSGIGPLTRNGNDFSFDFDYEWETGVACPDDVIAQSATVVLGALPPGDYALTTTSWGVPVGTTNFTVLTNSGQTLQPIGFSKNGTFQMQLNGVANVDYVLQSSTDLLKWTSLSTNLIGAPLTDAPSVSRGQRFYRVQIPKNVFLGNGLE
jgi:hypothetical protein